MWRLFILLLVPVCLSGQAVAQLPAIPTPKPLPVDVDTPADARVMGVLPNYRTANPYSIYKPLTVKQKMAIGAKDSFDYPLLFLGAILAGIDQAENSDPSYGQGAKGLAKRYAADYGDQMFGNLMTEGIMPSLLHQDPRYFRMSSGGFVKRTLHALSGTFVLHDDNGKLDFNYSEWVGNSVAVAISESYHPDDRTARIASEKLVEQCGVDAISTVLKEFWPDIRRRFSKKSQGAP